MPLGWTSRYWDILEQVFWVPSYIGLKSITKKTWQIEDGRVSLPKELGNMKSQIYTRKRSRDEYWAFIQRQEETFNHAFDLTLGIMDGQAIVDLFGSLAKLESRKALSGLGREQLERYSFLANANATQPDGFLTSEDAIFMIELKFNAPTSLDQLANYLAVALAEETLTGTRLEVALLYVVPGPDPKLKVQRQLGVRLEHLRDIPVELLIAEVQNEVTRRYLKANEMLLEKMMRRIRVTAISWSALHSSIADYVDLLGDGPGNKTLANLLSGLAEAIAIHPYSKAVQDGD